MGFDYIHEEDFFQLLGQPKSIQSKFSYQGRIQAPNC